MATEEQYKQALIQADRAGDKQAAQLFAAKIKELRQQSAEPSLPAQDFEPVGANPRARRASIARQKRQSEREQYLSTLDPAMRELIESQTPMDAFLIGTGRGMTNLARGVGLADDETEIEKQAIEGLREASGGAVGIGEFVGETAPFAPLGGAASLAGVPLKASLPALGALEGGVVASGQGGDAGDIALGATLGGTIGALPLGVDKAIGKIKSSREARQLIADMVRKGDPNVDIVAKTLNEQGKVVTSKPAKQALDTIAKDVGQEKAARAVSVIERMSPASKSQVNRMLDIIKDAKINPNDLRRPSNVLGESMARRAKAIQVKNKEAALRIGKIAKEKLAGKNIDISNASNQFFDDLQDMGVKVFDDKGRIKLDFSDSDFVGGDKVKIENIANRLKTGTMDGLKAHRTKQFTNDLVDFGQGTESAVKGRSADVLKNLSRNINEKLRGASSGYAKANDKFAATVDLRDAFQKLAGKDEDIFSEFASQRLGNKGMRLTSNATSRVEIAKTLENADEVLNKEFGVRFKDDIPSLVNAVNDIEDIFKIVRPNSFQGGIERAGVNIFEGMSPEAAATRGVLQKVQDLRTPDFDKKMKALRMLTKTNGK